MKNINKRTPHGFTLMELLLVVAIIGIMVNLVLFSWDGSKREVDSIKDRRNAQTIASLASTASVAGASFVVAGDVPATVQNLAQGTTPGSGIFKGREFKLPPMGPKEITGAIPYLQLRNSELMYDP